MERLRKITLASAIAFALCFTRDCSTVQSVKPGEHKTAAAKPPVRGMGHHAAEEQPNSKAKDTGDPAKTAAIQGWLNQNFGVTLMMDNGTRSLGLVKTNKEGRALASELNPNSGASGEVELVNVVGDDGWWREPDGDNAVVVIEMLNTDHEILWRAAAARGLGRAKTPQAFEVLRNTLKKGTDSIFRCAAVDGLASLGTPEAISLVKEAEGKDADQSVRDVAKQALNREGIGAAK